MINKNITLKILIFTTQKKCVSRHKPFYFISFKSSSVSSTQKVIMSEKKLSFYSHDSKIIKGLNISDSFKISSRFVAVGPRMGTLLRHCRPNWSPSQIRTRAKVLHVTAGQVCQSRMSENNRIYWKRFWLVAILKYDIVMLHHHRQPVSSTSGYRSRLYYAIVFCFETILLVFILTF